MMRSHQEEMIGRRDPQGVLDRKAALDDVVKAGLHKKMF